MTRTINIGGIDVAFKANGSTIRKYKEMFGDDLLDKFNRAVESVSAESIITLQNLAYIMARQADESIPDIDEWLDRFDTFPIDASLEIANLWKDSIATSVPPKKTPRHR